MYEGFHNSCEYQRQGWLIRDWPDLAQWGDLDTGLLGLRFQLSLLFHCSLCGRHNLTTSSCVKLIIERIPSKSNKLNRVQRKDRESQGIKIYTKQRSWPILLDLPISEFYLQVGVWCPNHTNFLSTSIYEIVGDATIAKCQVVYTNISAWSTFLLWFTATRVAILPPHWLKTVARQQSLVMWTNNKSLVVGLMHLTHVQTWMSKCRLWSSPTLSCRLDNDDPPWKSLWEIDSPTKNTLSIWCDRAMSLLRG